MLVTVDQLLIKAFSDRTFKNIKNPAFFNFEECTRMYKFSIKQLSEKLNVAPDCANPVPSTNPIRIRQNVPKYPMHIYNKCRRSFYEATTTDTDEPIDSAIKAAYVSTYGHDPKLKVSHGLGSLPR